MNSTAPAQSTSALGENPDLPPLSEAMLDNQTLERLFEDIQVHSELIEISIKGGAQLRAEAAPTDLGCARRLLFAGAVRGLQLRYRYRGTEWWDTLIRTKGGTRLVRIGHNWRE